RTKRDAPSARSNLRVVGGLGRVAGLRGLGRLRGLDRFRVIPWFRVIPRVAAFEGALPRREAKLLGDETHGLGHLVSLAPELVVLPLQVFELSAEPLGLLLGRAHPLADMRIGHEQLRQHAEQLSRLLDPLRYPLTRVGGPWGVHTDPLLKDISIRVLFLATCGSRRARGARRSAPARELQHGRVGARVQKSGKVRLVRPPEARASEAVTEANMIAEPHADAVGGQIEQARHLLAGDVPARGLVDLDELGTRGDETAQ